MCRKAFLRAFLHWQDVHTFCSILTMQMVTHAETKPIIRKTMNISTRRQLPMAKNENSNISYMTRRIGGTTYKVKVVFSDTEKETM